MIMVDRKARVLHGAAVVCLFFVLAGGARAQEGWTLEQYSGEGEQAPGEVYALGMDQAGRLLVGGYRGLFRSDGSRLVQIPLPTRPDGRSIKALGILNLKEGAVGIIGSDDRPYVWTGEEVHMARGAPVCSAGRRSYSGTLPSLEGLYQAMCGPEQERSSVVQGRVRLVGGAGQEWYARTADELLVYNGGALKARVSGVPKGDGTMLFRSGEKLFLLGDGGEAAMVDVGSTEVTTVPVGWSGQLEENGHFQLFWHEGSDGAVIKVGEQMSVLLPQPSMEAISVMDLGILLPQEMVVNDVLWRPEYGLLAVGGDKGLWVYRRAPMRTVSCSSGTRRSSNVFFTQAPLGEHRVLTIARDRVEHSVVFDGAECLHGGSPVDWFNSAGITWDGQGRLLYGRGDSLLRLDPLTGSREVLSTEGGVPPTFHVEEDTVWVAALKGLGKIFGDSITWTSYCSPEVLGPKPVALERGADGRFWIGGASGAFRFDEVSGDLVKVPRLSGIYVSSISRIGRTRFFTTYGNGLFIMDDHDVVRRAPMDALGIISHVHAIMPDSIGWWWLSTNQGMLRVRARDFEDWIQDSTKAVHYAYHGRRSGILNEEFNGGGSPPFIRLPNGLASFPTQGGLVQFWPEKVPSPWPIGHVMLEELSSGGVRLENTGTIRLSAHRPAVTVSLSLVHWGEPTNVRLEYSWSYEKTWTLMAPGQRVLEFGDIPSGRHVLRIRKATGPDERPLILQFMVPLPFYYRVWFILLVVLALAGMVIMVVRLNAARLRARNLALEKKVRSRTNDLALANQELQRSLKVKELLVSILSHDVVTPLRFVSRVAGDAASVYPSKDDDPLWPMIRDLAQASEKLHTNSKDLLRWIRHQDTRLKPRWRSLNMNMLVDKALNMVAEQAAAQGTELYNMVAEDHVLRTDREIISIILQNLLNNAITHTHGGRIVIDGGVVEDKYILRVSDTGMGMTAAAVEHVERLRSAGSIGAVQEDGEREVQGLGYIILADLLLLLKGSFRIQSERGKGTTVSIMLPIVL